MANHFFMEMRCRTCGQVFESKHVGNRRVALVNLWYDSDALNLLVYTKVNTVITADVIEFD